MQTSDLYVEKDSPHCLPLFGQFCFRLAGLAYCCEEEVLAGPLALVTSAGVTPVALWASLSNWRLSLWTDRSHKERPAWLQIDVNRDTAIHDKGADTLILRNGGRPWEFRFEEKENLHSWADPP